ncbi:MAG: HAD family hydrolase [Chloroflexota bacterium]|nr:MAG: haloacid dehalogenase [Chloroflexota bacterium]
MIELIAFDGDDTLWHNESIFSVTQSRFRKLLDGYVPGAAIDQRLLATEMRNLRFFGYGIKGFILSMIETSIEVTKGRVAAADIQKLIDTGKWMLEHPVELLDGVPEMLDSLASKRRLMIITKGDLFDQESKIARSGVTDFFNRIEIVSEKDESTYRRILASQSVSPDHFLMVGNSMKSDILPVLALGGYAVHIPYHLTWAHEVVDQSPENEQRLVVLRSIADLASVVASIDDGI